MSLIELFSRHVAYPLWAAKDHSHKLREYKRMLRSQWQAPEIVEQYQLGRLQRILSHAYQTVPWYRANWSRDPVSIPLTSITELMEFPIISKTMIRECQGELISKDHVKQDLVSAKTGGSTGVALELFFDTRCQEFRNAAAMMADGWAGWRPGMLVGALWGSPPIPHTAKEKIRNLLHDRVFYLDTMNLNPETMADFLAEARRRRAGALFGHAHSIYMLADFITSADLEVPEIEAIVSTSMMLLPSHRAVIEKTFRRKVTNRYGCEEVGLIACECEAHHGLHINADHVIVEVLDHRDNPCKPGDEGRIVVTDLNNYGMPLIRYELGDVARTCQRLCECGRGYPLIEEIVGRTADYLLKSDGSFVSGISLVERTLTAIPGIKQLQIVQEDINELVLNVVPDDGFSSATCEELGAVLRGVLGTDIKVSINTASSLQQEHNGKYRFAISRVL